MTAFSPYQAYPGPAPVLVAPPPVLVAVAGPAPQRRATVAFRYILAVPHVFLLYWIFLAAGVVAFIGWWGALFTGRLPQFAVNFLSGVLRWATRFYAYHYLLTDVYPPFTLDDDPSYPVRVAIPEPQRLNPAAVFFRYLLTLPVAFLAGIVIFGASTLMAFAAWLIALVGGKLPPSLHLAYVAVLRFQVRYIGYWWMLTPAYPGGLYGDRPGAVAWADGPSAAQAPGFSTPAPGFSTPAPGFGTPGGSYGNPVDNAPQGWGAPQGFGAPQANSTPQGWGASPSNSAPPANSTPPGYEPTQNIGGSQGFATPQGPGTPQGYGAAPQGFGAAPQGYGPPQGLGTPQGYGAAPQGFGTPSGAGAAPQGFGAPGYGAPGSGYGAPAGYGAAPAGYGPPGGYAMRPVFQPATWLLPLTSAAKQLVTAFIVLGSLFLIVYIAAYALIIGSAVSSVSANGTAVTAITQLNSSYTTLSDAVTAGAQAQSDCNQNLTCITKQDGKDASAFEAFSSQLADTPVPAGAEADKARLSATAAAVAQDYTQLSAATTAAQYESTLGRVGLQQAVNRFDQDYNALISQLETY